ncbi:toprim domain-containing protein [Gillisia hiemivivida]|uniref:Toprim domain-containing protein n=1 Tax=Gillisia hiemivivida TaxID=291190 RepID=A0A5C6ZYS7_9FLAO|nr:toprim domain-containing protein [Gillisia hiemivivida]TXD95501.1 toprim domain-containing protein [Gillisia hiemivivida]
MKKKYSFVTCERARNLSIVKTLARFGHFPNRTTEKEAWFLSPLRSETQASFKVSLILNKWHDHGVGKGGNGLDLIVALNKCSVKQVLELLNDKGDLFSFQQPILNKENSPKIEVYEVKPIQHQALIQYLDSRKISIKTANLYCNEIWYGFKGRNYFAMGLRNHLNGWELRNKFFKNSSSPKAYTYLKTHSDRLIILEGMFDLLSMAILFPNELINIDVIVLNSLSFLKPVSYLFKNYNEVDRYLDNDTAGIKYSKELIQDYKNLRDKSCLFEGYKDLNEQLI